VEIPRENPWATRLKGLSPDAQLLVIPAEKSLQPGARVKVKERELEREPIIRCSGIAKSYYREDLEIPVLQGLDLEIPRAAITPLMGPRQRQTTC